MSHLPSVAEVEVCWLKPSARAAFTRVVGPAGRARRKMSISPFESGGMMAAGVAKATDEPSAEMAG
jgi:hypothetical protein